MASPSRNSISTGGGADSTMSDPLGTFKGVASGNPMNSGIIKTLGDQPNFNMIGSPGLLMPLQDGNTLQAGGDPGGQTAQMNDGRHSSPWGGRSPWWSNQAHHMPFLDHPMIPQAGTQMGRTFAPENLSTPTAPDFMKTGTTTDPNNPNSPGFGGAQPGGVPLSNTPSINYAGGQFNMPLKNPQPASPSDYLSQVMNKAPPSSGIG